jgi:hypothetical protein
MVDALLGIVIVSANSASRDVRIFKLHNSQIFTYKHTGERKLARSFLILELKSLSVILHLKEYNACSARDWE